MRNSFVPGSVWTLSKNASCIPAGRYQLQDVQDELLIFSVGRDIIFGLSKDYYASILEESSSARPMRTTSNSFLRRYAKLLQSPSRTPLPPSGITFCAMAPRLQRKLRKLCPEEMFSSGATVH